MLLRRLPALALTVALPLMLPARQARAQSPDTEEPGSREAIAAATTEPRFVTPWVAYVPDKPGIPSPTKFLGHIVGAPGELSNTTKIYAYYRALAAATRRVRVEVIGKSEEGREILLVAVGDEKTPRRRRGPPPRHGRARRPAPDRREDGRRADRVREARLPAARRAPLGARPARPRC